MNPLFQQQVAALFSKLAWPHNPMEVAEQLRAQGDHSTADDIMRGRGIGEFASRAGEKGVEAAKAVERGVSRVMAPAHTEGKALFRELSAAGEHIASQPGLLRAGVGTLLLAPILGGAVYATQQKREDELMNRQMNPTKMGSLDQFLKKKASANMRMMPAIKGHMHESFTGGLGQGIGKSVADAILGVMGGTVGGIHQTLIVDPQRKRMFESVVRNDPVVHDALTRHPDAAKTLGEAYQTMVRFAPSLSLDVNAVRSFLREAVVGGSGGVNYATIKTLIETEKGLRSPGDHR